MKTKRYVRAVRSGKLTEELFAAFPTWVSRDDPGGARALFSVETDAVPLGTWAQITWPDTTPITSVDAVVAAHDGTTPSLVEQQATQDGADISAFPTRTQISNALAQLNIDLNTLAGNPSNAQVIAILNRTVTNQRAVIRALNVLVRRGQ